MFVVVMRLKAENYIEDGVPVIRIGDINGDTVGIESSVTYEKKFWEDNESFRVYYDDILIAYVGCNCRQSWNI